MNMQYQSLELCLVLTYVEVLIRLRKDKKLELLKLTLYRNLGISDTMDMIDLLVKTKTEQVNMLKNYKNVK